jgi:hypothetical protein
LNIAVKAYTELLLQDWNQVIRQSTNGTLMHSRSYMEYHNDRFVDASLVVYLNGSPVAVFPAHQVEDEVYSHQGLTYGGLVIHQDLKTEHILAVLRELLKHYYHLRVTRVYIKAVPSFYGASSLEWMSYGMFLLGAEVYRTDLSFAVPLPVSTAQFTKGRKWALNKAFKTGLRIEEVNDFRPFWKEILVPNLWERHGVKPVHTVEEMQWLAENNAPFIRQFDVLEEGRVVAGMTVFETQTTAHAQYISASPRGKELAALDLLIDHLVRKVFSHKAYFDFGTVNEDEGRRVNKGLMDWKESFGAKPYVHPFYKVETDRFGLLEEAMR